MPITQNLDYLTVDQARIKAIFDVVVVRGGLVTAKQFDLLAAPLGRSYSYEEVKQMVRDHCVEEADESDYDDWTHVVISAAITTMLAAERG